MISAWTVSSVVLSALTLASTLCPAAAQTFSVCNPLQQSGCPADPALGRSVDVDFTSNPSTDFTSSGKVSYAADGAAFTVAQSGDSPSIHSNWYIMFGHVDYVIQAAPGTGIVSAAVLQSDCLDEIDWEWLGGDDTQAQSNYFGKGITTTGYNRGAFHGAPNNHDGFHTYSIDWTADQIVWSIDGTVVRAMTPAQAEPGQYPQTPMYVKVGAWAGGDPSNPPGTVQWAGGPTDYSAGPFTMYLKSVHVTDYSTGSQYSYSGTRGTWDTIVADGGAVNGQGHDTPTSTAAGAAPAVTSHVSAGAPLAFGNNDGSQSGPATRTGWPWSGTATAAATTVVSASTPGLTRQCFLCSSSAPWSSLTLVQTPRPSFLSASASSWDSASSPSLEVVTSWDDRGFPTLVTVDPAAPSTAKSYDSQGFLITNTGTASAMSSSVISSTADGLSPSTASGASGLPGSLAAPTATGAAAATATTAIAATTGSVSSALVSSSGANSILTSTPALQTSQATATITASSEASVEPSSTSRTGSGTASGENTLSPLTSSSSSSTSAPSSSNTTTTTTTSSPSSSSTVKSVHVSSGVSTTASHDSSAATTRTPSSSMGLSTSAQLDTTLTASTLGGHRTSTSTTAASASTSTPPAVNDAPPRFHGDTLLMPLMHIAFFIFSIVLA